MKSPLIVLLLALLATMGCTPRTTVAISEQTTAAPVLTRPPVQDIMPLPSKDLFVEADIPVLTKNDFLKHLNLTPVNPPPFFSPTKPLFKMRNDTRGDGHFGASRGRRVHNGLDLVVSPGSAVYSPIEGVVVRRAYPYGERGRNKKWEGIVIDGKGRYEGYEVKIFYIIPFMIGHYVEAEDIIGKAQAISKKYSPDMIDHVHVEVRYYGRLVDPMILFDVIE